jgi:alpha-tubulin suppressor-like RCC1 family protein
VLVFGRNISGCLELGHKNEVEVPQNMEELFNQQINDISYGHYHVLALTKSGKAFRGTTTH